MPYPGLATDCTSLTIASTLQPLVCTSLTTASTPQPLVCTSLTTASTPQPLAHTSLTTMSTPQPLASTPLTTMSIPQPLACTSLTSVSTSQPLACTSLTTASTPQPLASISLSAMSTPQPSVAPLAISQLSSPTASTPFSCSLPNIASIPQPQTSQSLLTAPVSVSCTSPSILFPPPNTPCPPLSMPLSASMPSMSPALTCAYISPTLSTICPYPFIRSFSFPVEYISSSFTLHDNNKCTSSSSCQTFDVYITQHDKIQSNSKSSLVCRSEWADCCQTVTCDGQYGTVPDMSQFCTTSPCEKNQAHPPSDLFYDPPTLSPISPLPSPLFYQLSPTYAQFKPSTPSSFKDYRQVHAPIPILYHGSPTCNPTFPFPDPSHFTNNPVAPPPVLCPAHPLQQSGDGEAAQCYPQLTGLIKRLASWHCMYQVSFNKAWLSISDWGWLRRRQLRHGYRDASSEGRQVICM